MRVAFVGLGVMGYPMAGYLINAGHEVVVFNRTTSKADAWVDQYGGSRADTPSAAGSKAEIVFCCVGNDDDVRAVILGDDGVLHGIGNGSVIVDHTTASATVARDVYAAAAAKNVGFLDAPLSGGQAGAENGQLTIMVGGDEDVYQRALPVMDGYAKACTLIGPVGSGQLAKMVNQIWHRRHRTGLVRRPAFREAGGSGYGQGYRRNFERRCAILADGESLGDHGPQ